MNSVAENQDNSLDPETCSYNIGYNKHDQLRAIITMAGPNGKHSVVGFLFGMERKFLEDCARATVDAIRRSV